MIFLAGISLIILLALAGGACRGQRVSPVEIGPGTEKTRRQRRWAAAGYTALAVALALLLLRPDEEIEAGEDAAAYFNAAVFFAEKQQIRFPDPALSEIRPSERKLFRYGHEGFWITKDHSLWSRDWEMEEVGPHFFPAYSILLSVPISLGLPYAAFWTSPVFAVGVGWLLALLAVRLTGSRLAGGLAFLLFILNPAVIWNARCLRAEWPAAFLALAGIVLWPGAAGHETRSCKRVPAAAFVGGLALAAAGGFHATALFVLIPAVLASLWLTRRTAFWTAWWCGLLLGLGLFLAQVAGMADPYRLGDVWADTTRRNLLLMPGILFLLATAGGRMIFRRGLPFRKATRERAARLAGALISLSFVLIVLLLLRYRDQPGMIPGLPAWTAAYHSLTDFAGVGLVFSRPGLAAALAGLVVLCVRPGPEGRIGRRLFILLAPAALTIGWVVNYMFETRRMIAFLAPLFVLATATLLVAAGGLVSAGLKRRRPKRAALARAAGTAIPCLLGTILLVAAVRGRTQIYTTWNNRGLFRFYRELAGEAREEGDFLMAEYTQTAVPAASLSGLPLLPIAWGYRTEAEYREAEQVLARTVRVNPGRRHLLLSPFSGAAVPGLRAEPLFSRKLETVRLGRARRSVPENVYPFHRTLHLYRLLPPGEDEDTATYTRVLNRGMLGLAGGANYLPARRVLFRGIPLGEENAGRIAVQLPAGRSAGSLFLVVAFPGSPTAESAADKIFPDLPGNARRFELGPGWKGIEFRLPPGGEPAITLDLRAERPAYLTDLFWEDAADERVRRVNAAAPRTAFRMENMGSRWLRASSSVALPSGPAPRRLWLLAAAGREETTGPRASLRPREGEEPAFDFPVETGWNWYPIPLAASEKSGFRWYELEISPAWDPGLPNFPADLGILVHLLTVTPEE